MTRRAVFWSFSSQILVFALQFATSVVMARLLSPVELGVYGVALSVIGIVTLFANFSVGTYVVREAELSDDTVATAFTINAIVSTALAALIFAASFVAGRFFDNAAVGPVLRLLAVTPILAIASFLPTTMLQRAMQLRGVSIAGAVAAGVGSAVGVGAAFLGAGALSPAYGAVATGVVSTAALLLIGRRHLSFRMSLRSWRPMAAFGLRLMSIGGISTAAARASDIILGRVLGLAALGLYGRASNLSNMLFTNVYGSATRVIFARLSAAQRDEGRITEVFFNGLRLIVAVMGPLDLGLAVLSGPAIRTIYGERWLGAALPLSILCVGQFVSFAFAMNWELYVLRDELPRQTRLELWRSATGVIFQTIGCFFSLTAVALSSLVHSLFSVALYGPDMARLAEVRQARLFRVYGEAVVLGVAAAAPPFLVMAANRWDAAAPLSAIVPAIALGIGAWAAALRLLGHPLIDEMRLVLSKLSAGSAHRGAAAT